MLGKYLSALVKDLLGLLIFVFELLDFEFGVTITFLHLSYWVAEFIELCVFIAVLGYSRLRLWVKKRNLVSVFSLRADFRVLVFNSFVSRTLINRYIGVYLGFIMSLRWYIKALFFNKDLRLKHLLELISTFVCLDNSVLFRNVQFLLVVQVLVDLKRLNET